MMALAWKVSRCFYNLECTAHQRELFIIYQFQGISHCLKPRGSMKTENITILNETFSKSTCGFLRLRWSVKFFERSVGLYTILSPH